MPKRMRRAAASGLLALGVALGVVWAASTHAQVTTAEPVSVWVTSRARTDVGLATRTEIRRVDIDGAGVLRAETLGAVEHPADAIVRVEAVQPAGRFLGVAVVADEGAGRRAFGAALSYVPVVAGRAKLGAARRLTTGLASATRPLVGDDGLVYVQRGSEGLPPTRDEARRGLLRVDALEIDAVDVETGAVRVVTTWQGYATHLAGALADDLVVYRVGPRGAEIVRVDRRSGKTRVVAQVPPFARDFSVDVSGRALVFSDRDDIDPSRWGVVRLDLESGAAVVLSRVTDEAPIPFALDGGVVVTSERAPDRYRLRVLGAGTSRAAQLPPGSGAGPTFVTRARRDGAFWAITHVGGGASTAARFDRVGLFSPRSGRVIDLSSEAERVELVGFVDDRGNASGGALR